MLGNPPFISLILPEIRFHVVWGILDMITGGHTEHTGYVWMETRDKGQASEALCTNTLLYDFICVTYQGKPTLFARIFFDYWTEIQGTKRKLLEI